MWRIRLGSSVLSVAAALSVAPLSLTGQSPAIERSTNVAALSAGARLVSFSTQWEGGDWKAANILDGKPNVGWSSNGAAFPQSFVVELAGEFLLSRFSFDNGTPSDVMQTAKEIRLAVSVEAEDVGYRDAGTFTLNKGESAQGFKLPIPVRAHWVKLIVLSNHGATNGTHLMEFRAIGLPARQQTSETDAGFRVTLPNQLLFDTDQSALRAEGEKALSEALPILMEYPSARLLVEGHTDSTGAAGKNQQLSEARANSVRDWLDGNRGSARWTVETKGLGASQPAASNNTPSGRLRNRRVDITILR